MPNLAANPTFGFQAIGFNPEDFADVAAQPNVMPDVNQMGDPTGIPNISQQGFEKGALQAPQPNLGKYMGYPLTDFTVDPHMQVVPPNIDPQMIAHPQQQLTPTPIAITPQKGFLNPPTLNMPFMQEFELDKPMVITPQIDIDPMEVSPHGLPQMQSFPFSPTPQNIAEKQEAPEPTVTPDLSFTSPMFNNVPPTPPQMQMPPPQMQMPPPQMQMPPPQIMPPPSLTIPEIETPIAFQQQEAPMSMEDALNATLSAMNPTMAAPDENAPDSTTGAPTSEASPGTATASADDGATGATASPGVSEAGAASTGDGSDGATA